MAGGHNTAAGLVLAFLGGGGKKDGKGVWNGVVTAAQQWHLDGTCKLLGSGDWERSRGTHRGVPTYCKALCQGSKSPETSAEQMSGQERTTSVGPSDTKREHGSGTGRHHMLVAPAGPKRRLLHAQGMEQHGLTPGSSLTSHFSLLGSENTWWLESQGQSMWKTLLDMQPHLPSHLPPQWLWPICVSQQSQNVHSPSGPHPCTVVYSFARAWLAQAKAKAAPCTLPVRPPQHPACRQHCRQRCRQQSTQEPVTWQRAPAWSMQPVQPCGLPPTPALPGKRLSCIQRLLDGGQQLPAPFQAVQTSG
ncbi:uncharacterized protein LOC115483979 [Serinus canaria]|uniref:uncharacterized protein LOC115483979 n=1 Tax=Serinus canaria TaxID=9135 RepID=UPI0021CC701F|nr:uncharacterized protein LOC115483979 [Serinus canaria]